MGTHRNARQSRMFVVNLTVLFFISDVESVFWLHILLKICAFAHWVWKVNGYSRSTAQFAKTNTK